MKLTGTYSPPHHELGTPEPPVHAHTVQFYDDPMALTDRVGAFVAEALTEGGAVVVVASPAHQNAIADTLSATGYDLDRARASGHYLSLDAAHVLEQVMVDGQVAKARFDSAVGEPVRRAIALATRSGGPVAVFGELVALLADDDAYGAAIDIERCWNALAQRYPFALHCGYPMSAFSGTADGEALARICDAHTEVEPTESYTALPTPDAQSRQIVLLQQKANALEREVAARVQAERALQEQYRELQAALVAREEFLAVAAHELRTPMTGLRGNAQMLRRNFQCGRAISPERTTRSLETIENLSLRLNHLITRLLDPSQIEAGTLRLTPVSTDLVDLVRSVIDQQSAHDVHTLQYDGPNRLDALVDAVRFEQVITNLIDNGIRYNPNGGEITVRLVDNAADGIELAVTDSGPGIPTDQRDVVFASYRQGRADGRFAGIGLGLFVSRQIVELHGGSMRIEDPEHPGTRIVITLPALPGAHPSMAVFGGHFDAD